MADASAKKESGGFVAWSNLRGGKGEEIVEVKPGESVTASQLGLNDEQFQQLVDAGSVRKQKYPDMPEGYQDSPVNRMRELAAEAEESDLSLFDMPQSAPFRSDVAEGSAITSPAPPSA
jgi:hypothetical protein